MMTEVCTQWKIGDWAVCDLSIVQIKELRDGDDATVSDSFFETSGRLIPRLRPLTLASKRAVETFDIYYKRLKEINGNGGFNYPRIVDYFSQLALDAIDEPTDETPYLRGEAFVREARNYKSVIDGVDLFRPTLRSAS